MTIDSSHLLQRLAGPFTRPGTGPAIAPPRLPLEAQTFDQVLSLVSRGEVHSDRPVTTSSAVDPGLDHAQLQRLAGAADLAEASGARRAVMSLDGRALIVDVTSRHVLQELASTSPNEVVPVDAAVLVASEDSANPPFRLKLPGHGLQPRLDLAPARFPAAAPSSTPDRSTRPPVSGA